MSKASEYARKHDENVRPAINLGDYGAAKVQDNADLFISISYPLPPGKALELEKWIIDTFGERDEN